MDPNQLAIAIGTGFGLIVSGTISGVVLLLNTRQQHKAQDRDATLQETRDLLERQDKRIDRLEAEVAKSRQSEAECQGRLIRAAARIERLEETLEASNIPFRRWSPDDTGPHRPVGGASP